MANLLRHFSGRMNLRNRRVRQKYCLFLACTGFFLMCVGMVFFLPDLRARTTTGVQDVYQKLPDLFLAPHLPPPPPASLVDKENQLQSLNSNSNLVYNTINNHISNNNYNDQQGNQAENVNVGPRPLIPPSPRYLLDRAKLLQKIQEDQEAENRKNGILEKPKIVPNVDPSKSSPIISLDANVIVSSSPHSKNINNKKSSKSYNNIFGHLSGDEQDHNLPAKNILMPPPNLGNKNNKNDVNSINGNKNNNGALGQSPVPVASPVGQRNGLINASDIIIQGGEDTDSLARSRREAIRQMTKDAWDSYVKYAWGQNELKPVSQRGHSSSIFGPSRIGATIVDAVDTLYIMGLMDEYKTGRDWIADNLDFDNIRAEMSVFETNIRFVGGFLSMYALTGDTMYRDKAYKLAKKLLPAFDTPTGIPYALINLHSGSSKNYGWAASGSSILAEFGSLHLEFTYLSDVTGDPIFKEKVYRIRQTLKDMDKPKGLYANYVHPRMAKFTQNHVSMGALGDSFYEYLLKSYLQTGDEDARKMYDDAMSAFETNSLIRYSKEGLLYFAEMRYDRIESKMDHLACFAGGMLALGAQTHPEVRGKTSIDKVPAASRHLKMGEGIANTCHESYIRTATRLGPESFRFSDAMEARAQRQNERYYILRPEVVETYMYMWRITGDPKYREWGWDAAQSIEKHCKAGPGGGYSGLRNVYAKDPQQDDVQQTFFFAETLKYLYLLFSSKDLMNLDYWIFNTEAHPLPIKSNNPYYRPFYKQVSSPSSSNL